MNRKIETFKRFLVKQKSSL